jgi:hypothetical protein
MMTEKWGGEIEVVVKNNLEKGIFVDVFVDKSSKTKWIRANAEQNYGIYSVSTGLHVLKLRWMDPDTREIKEKSEKIEISPGEKKIKTLYLP